MTAEKSSRARRAAPPLGATLSAEERAGLDRVLARVARSADAVEEVLDGLDHLSASGALAGVNGVLEEFDENFSAVTRPEAMSMAANLMMLMGALGQISYQPFFDTAMRLPAAVDRAYPALLERREPLSGRELLRLLRSPEVAGALELLVGVLRAYRAQDPPPDPGR